MGTWRAVWIGAGLAAALLGAFLAQDAFDGRAPPPAPGGQAPPPSDFASSPPLASPGAPACSEGTRLVERKRSRFCAVATADGPGSRSGPFVRFHDPGLERRAEAGRYRGGRKEGPWLEWYPSGARRSRLEFRGGVAHGRWLEWHENGTPKSEGRYAEGEEDGSWRFWLASGELSEEGAMRRGEREGVWTGWHPGGVERYRRRYAEGIAVAWEVWDPNGISIDASDGGADR